MNNRLTNILTKRTLYVIIVSFCLFWLGVSGLHAQDTLALTYDAGINLVANESGGHALVHYTPETQTVKQIPLWTSIIPPLLAIILALLIKEVHLALFAGIFSGVFIANGLSFKPKLLFKSVTDIIDTYFINAVTDSGHASIIIFSLLIGGMVAIITANGGMQGVMNKVSKIATSARRAEFATWLMGILIFFDDYANTLVVGNTMRPLTDKFKISREKLAYIVDSTAAPMAAIGLVTTWIGFQLSEINNGLQGQTFMAGLDNVYMLFLQSLKYAFYPFLTLFFVLLLIITRRDFGAMRKIVNHKINLEASAKQPKASHWVNAFLPVFTLIFVVLLGLLKTGGWFAAENTALPFFEKLRTVIGNSDSYVALLWASLMACAVAIIISVITQTLSLIKATETLIDGLKSMLPAVVILVLAWSLAEVIEVLHTKAFLASLIPQQFNVRWLPAIIFVISAFVAFSTGSSWGTMGVVYPLVIPLVLELGTQGGVITNPEIVMPVLLNTISIVLAAAVFGDHCSPISDTTIMSSMASGSDHIAHFRTQLPYALTVGAISFLCGGVLFGLGAPLWLSYIIGIGLVLGAVFGIGKVRE